MNSVLNSSQVAPTKPTFACVRCSERKVKCDRQVPCYSCVRHNASCIYPPPKPSRRRDRLIDESIHERLRRYESLLQQSGIDPEQVNRIQQVPVQLSTPPHIGREQPSTSLVLAGPARQLSTPASASSDPRTTVFKPEVIQGRAGTRLVDK
jgi:hypothetical protein